MDHGAGLGFDHITLIKLDIEGSIRITMLYRPRQIAVATGVLSFRNSGLVLLQRPASKLLAILLIATLLLRLVTSLLRRGRRVLLLRGWRIMLLLLVLSLRLVVLLLSVTWIRLDMLSSAIIDDTYVPGCWY